MAAIAAIAMTLLAAALAIVAPLGVGAAIAPPGARPWSLWSLGAIASAVMAIIGIALRLPPIAVAIAVGALAVVGAMRAKSRRAIGTTLPLTERLFSAWLFTLLICGVVITVAAPVHETDAVAMWHPKMRAFVAWAPFDEWAVPHYPPLGAVLWGAPLMIAGLEHESLARSIFMAYYVAWAASLRECLPRPLSPAAALAVGGAALAALDQAMVTSGYQDPLIASVAGMAGAWLARDLIDRRPGSAGTGLALSGALGLIKVEGVVLGPVMAGAWLLARLARHGRDRLPWRGLLLFGALAVLWPMVKSILGIGGSAIWMPDSPAVILSNLDRLPVILTQFLSLRPTFYLPAAAAVISVGAAWRLAPAVRAAQAWTFAVLIAYTGAAIALFMMTLAPLDWHLITLFSRLMAQQLPLWLLIVVLGVHGIESASRSR